jgi:cytoskeletal protein CcmA (bactofilin family)
MMSSDATDEVTVISKNTIIDGNVRSLANMQIDGNIKGNVETTRNIDMTGKIVGDITCNNAGMSAAAMQGNVSLKGKMRMDRDTILIGDLTSQYADINGRIRGKLEVAGKAELKRDAIVFGDINASTIAVTDGAIIQGYVNTTFLSQEDGRNAIPEAISFDKENR